MSGAYVGAIDQGTKGTRFLVFDHDGSLVANAYERHEQIVPEEGWLEHDPVEIWDDVVTVISEGLDSAEIRADELAALGVTNQRETALVWDEQTGEPVHNAIVWEDRRTSDRIDELDPEDEARIREKTGLHPDAYFSASKIEWILDRASSIRRQDAASTELRTQAERGELCVGTIDSWLLYNLTGEHLTDVTNASRTLLFDIEELAWDEELLVLFDIPRAALPEVRPSAQLYGRTDPDGFLGTDVPVAGAIGDQQAAMLGQHCFERGDIKATYGTGAFSLMNTGEEPVRSERGLLTTVGYQFADEQPQYALEGAILTSGGAIEWLESIGLVESSIETERLAKSVASTDGVYIVPSFTGMGTPHWDPRARGTIVGLTRGSRREHLVRATLEATAYQTREIVEAMTTEAGTEIGSIRVDGGAVKNDFFAQLQADLIQQEIVRPVIRETTALGAAYAAGLAVGYWGDIDEIRSQYRVDSRLTPELDGREADKRYSRWSDAVERSRNWARDQT